MERFCPECMGALEVPSAGVARCTVHGGEYKILFWREEVSLVSPSPLVPESAPSATGAHCVNHVNLPAAFVCRRCNATICGLCSFPQEDGSRLCPACAMVATAEPVSIGGVSAVMLAVEGKTCRQHPNVAAIQICKVCGVPMCATCDFVLPGNLHVCPTCATTPQTSLNPKRKKMIVGSFVLAVWCTLALAALMTGAFRGMANDKGGEEVLGLILTFTVLIPSIIGVSLGVGAMDRRLPNTIAMWIATAWNGVILGGFIILMIVGMMSK